MNKKIIGILVRLLFIGTSITPVFGRDIRKNLNDVTTLSLANYISNNNMYKYPSNWINNNYKETNSLNLAMSPNEWIKYNDGHTENGLGATGGGSVTEAIELTDTELSAFRDYVICEIQVSIGSDDYGAYPGIPYEIWIESTLPADPYASGLNIVATGTSTSAVWHIIDVVDTPIPDTGSIYVGVNYNHGSGEYPCGVDQSITTPTRGGLFYMTALGWSDLGSVGVPGVWGLDVGVCNDNNPPYTPSNPTPSNHATNVDIDADLIWTGGDPDGGDTVTYDVYFEAGDSSPDVLVSYGQSDVIYDPGTMNNNTKYYWQIVSKDNNGGTANGPIWDFTTITEPNNPPNVPSNPNPVNHATSVYINTIISWTGGDPDTGDTVTYDVYFGTNSNPPKVSTWQSSTSYNPGELEYSTKYYWKIVAIDDHWAYKIGPVWDFITSSMGNYPPSVYITFPVENDNVSGFVNISGTASDQNGNNTLTQVQVNIDNKSWNNATGTENWNYSWNTAEETDGIHTIYARSYDGEIYSNFSVVNVTVINAIPEIIIDGITRGLGVRADIKNIGTDSAEHVDWSVDVDVGFGIILSGSHTEGVINELSADDSKTIQSSGLRGIGPITITVQADDATKQAKGFLLGPLVLRVIEL